MEKIGMFKILKSLSGVMDLISNSVVSHHKKVTYIAYKIGKEMKLEKDDLKKLTMSALVHDIGVFYLKDVNLNDFNFDDKKNFHAVIGSYLLNESQSLNEISLFIKYHHTEYNEYFSEIPLFCNILHLSDRIAFLTEEYDIYGDNSEIIKIIEEKSGIEFWPDAVNVYKNIADKEYFCLDMKSNKAINRELDKVFSLFEYNISLDKITEIIKVISHIIDFRSSFTANHSIGVAIVAKELSRLMGFSGKEQLIMEIAGYLHDIGKLVVPPEILNKNGKLNQTEWKTMRTHTYYTYQVLDNIDELPNLKEWAAYHHETLDGNGYPFHIKSNGLSRGARIMAVADIFTAITEDRPYRSGMDRNRVTRVFSDLVENNKIDKTVVNILFHNYDHINRIRKASQKESEKYYQDFKSKIHKFILKNEVNMEKEVICI